MNGPRSITSRDNALLVCLRKLARDATAYRKLGEIWVEGEHLCTALQARAWVATQAVLAESASSQTGLAALAAHAADVIVVPDKLFAELSPLPSPAGIGLVCKVPVAPAIEPAVATVVLDRIQDAGNVGSILRSASAMGVRQVLALSGTAALWSPKVLRAGMGSHFALSLHEGLGHDALSVLALPLVAASSHATHALPQVDLPRPCAWVFGHEGQGVAEALLEQCSLTVRIPQPGGEESLNVAAAAAICLYESLRRSPGQ